MGPILEDRDMKDRHNKAGSFQDPLLVWKIFIFFYDIARARKGAMAIAGLRFVRIAEIFFELVPIKLFLKTFARFRFYSLNIFSIFHNQLPDKTNLNSVSQPGGIVVSTILS